jgi:hypothetical protein
MQSLSRLSHLPASLTRNKKLDTTTSLTRDDPSDPSFTADTTVHVRRAPLAQIDQQLFAHSPVDFTSPALSPHPRAPSESILPPRAVGKPIMPRRSSYTSEDSLYTATGNSSQAYRRLSQYVFNFRFHHFLCASSVFPSNLNSTREISIFRSISDTGLMPWLTSCSYPTPSSCSDHVRSPSLRSFLPPFWSFPNLFFFSANPGHFTPRVRQCSNVYPVNLQSNSSVALRLFSTPLPLPLPFLSPLPRMRPSVQSSS